MSESIVCMRCGRELPAVPGSKTFKRPVSHVKMISRADAEFYSSSQLFGVPCVPEHVDVQYVGPIIRMATMNSLEGLSSTIIWDLD